MSNPFKRKKHKLRDLDVTRVDLVDEGANQHANIVLAKAAPPPPNTRTEKPKPKPKQQAASKPSGSKPPSGPKPPASDNQDRASALLQRMKERGIGAPGGAAGPPSGSPPSSQPSTQSGGQRRIAQFTPDNFEVVSEPGAKMTEWSLMEDSLPEGIEEVSVLMAQDGEGKGSYQWMVDPTAGPPEEGTAKTPAEAFMAIRAKLTQHNAGFGSELGGFPAPGVEGMPPPGMPGMPPPPPGMPKPQGAVPGQPPRPRPQQPGQPPAGQKPVPAPNVQDRQRRRTGVALRAVNALRKQADATPLEPQVESIESKGGVVTATKKADVAATDPVDIALSLVAKGLADVDIFVEDVTGEDLRGILPKELLDELSDKLSADEHRSNQEDNSDG